jgi:EmrB/QacA subfamily drug resistance transporter
MSVMGSLPRRQVVVTFTGVLLAIFLGAMDQTIVATALPDIIAELGGFTHYTLVTTAYLVSSTVLIPITGRLTDLFGRKWFYTAGIAIFILGSLLCGLSQTLTQLVFFRAFQGIGAGVMIANAFAVIGDLFPPAERGKYQGYVSAIFGLASVIGPSLGGFLTDTISWHWIFYINVPIGIGVIILFVFFFPNLRPVASEHRIDYLGIALLVLTTVPLMLALTWGGVQYPWLSPEIIGMIVFSLVMGVIFYRLEVRNPAPILPLGFFTSRIISISLAVTLFIGFGMFGGIIFIPLYFQGVLGLSATASGSFLTPMMLGVVAGSVTSGQLLSRAGGHYKLLGIVGIAIMAGGMGLLSTLTTQTSFTTAVSYIVLTGLGLGVTFPIYTVAIQNAVPHRFMGVVISAVPFSRFIGGTFGLAILGSLMSSRFSAQFLSQIPPTVKGLITQDKLLSLAHNPQALVSAQAQQELKSALAQLGPQADQVYNQIIEALRQSLMSALTEVFIIGLAATVIAFIIHLFIREIPLRRQHEPTEDGS